MVINRWETGSERLFNRSMSAYVTVTELGCMPTLEIMRGITGHQASPGWGHLLPPTPTDDYTLSPELLSLQV